jgi:hypothetical protein
MKDYSKHGITELRMYLYDPSITPEVIFESLINNLRKKRNKTALKKVRTFMGSFPQALSDSHLELLIELDNL